MAQKYSLTDIERIVKAQEKKKQQGELVDKQHLEVVRRALFDFDISNQKALLARIDSLL
ncbi:MAG: hypothetical protein JKX79_05140 [Labilibaculum sp.]|nr:hypothetical protein [Labilibaculum sp.]